MIFRVMSQLFDSTRMDVGIANNQWLYKKKNQTWKVDSSFVRIDCSTTEAFFIFIPFFTGIIEDYDFQNENTRWNAYAIAI